MNEKKKALITGAAGCLGRSLLDYLSADFDITGVYHNHPVDRGHYRLLKLDLTQPLDIEEKFDVIIHAAACLKGTALQMLQANCMATANIIKFGERTKVSEIIYVSSVSVFGRCNGGVLTENGSINAPEKYGTSKLLSEQLIEESSIPKRYVIRMPRILSKYMDMSADYSGFTVMLKKILRNEDVLCDIYDLPYNNYMFSDDIGEFLKFLMCGQINDGRECFNAVNLGATEQLTMGELLETIKLAAGSTSKIIASEKKGSPACSQIDVTKAEKMGLQRRNEKERLSMFGKQISEYLKTQDENI